ncbi:MAG: BMP family ABC transporter substrate-binding protein [Eubacteriales bacterium]|nr:BMP family ABC transporter substrate-binding protein [Clostridium sp.]MDY5797566.1 BMP family ABC transporter substrate-binding protein [Eubacteriales bacterium]
MQMKKFVAFALVLAMAFALCACTPNEDKDDFKVGVILVGDENEGYTYAHMEGIEAARVACGLEKDQIIYKYNIGENEACHQAAVDLVEQGCKIVFANSFGHESFLIQAAKEYPDVLFCHATGQTAAKQTDLKNIFNYFTAIYEARYVSGVVAGMKLKELMDNGTVTDPHVGYVGAYPYAEVVSGYTAFFLGIQSIVPDAYMEVQYTNKWFDLTLEAEAANALMARGCVIIGQHADSTGAPSAIQAAHDDGTYPNVYSVGYNIDMLNVAPDVALTSPQNNWGAYYTYAIKTAMEGKEMQQDWCYGYIDEAVQISQLGTACAEGTQEAVAAVIEKIKNGELHVFDCSTFTVNGEHLTSYDKSYGFDGVELIWDGYFHESEVISAPLFDIRIDGITELG